MTKFIRNQCDILKTRLAEQRKTIQVIAGPRQVGKSTMVDQVLQTLSVPYFSYNADTVLPQDGDWISRIWENARIMMEVQNLSEAVLVIDEIQKIERWSEYVKREWDTDTLQRRNLKVVLLGSSRLLLRKGLTESLFGRFEMIRMGHWSYQEMHEAFGLSLKQWIYYGGFPGAVPFMQDLRRWRKYVKNAIISPAIEKDIVLTSNIYKPALMKQLFELGCTYSSQLLSLTKLLGQLQDAGNVTTLASYLELLKQGNLLRGLSKYAQDEARKRQSVPKFAVYNNAFLTALHGKGLEIDGTDSVVWGRWVESAVGVYLLDFVEENDGSLYYWRNGDDEVDYIVTMDGETIAIEVKSGRRSMNSGLPAFAQKYHPKRSVVVGTDGLDLETFFTCNIENIF